MLYSLKGSTSLYKCFMLYMRQVMFHAKSAHTLVLSLRKLYRALTVGACILQLHGIRGAWQMNKKELITQLVDATRHSAAAADPND